MIHNSPLSQPIHMFREPRRDTPAEQNYGWLESEIATPLRAIIGKLAESAAGMGWPRRLEAAISDLESAADNIGREMDELDGGNP